MVQKYTDDKKAGVSLLLDKNFTGYGKLIHKECMGMIVFFSV